MRKTTDFFIPITAYIEDDSLVDARLLYETESLHELCKVAAKDLQTYIKEQTQWNHNFGLSGEVDGTVIGKMFGVLVVRNEQNEIGYIAAFSGKLAGKNQHVRFVPPVFDALTENSFLTIGMIQLSEINREISNLELNATENAAELEFLRAERRDHSIVLQKRLFENYCFLNKAGKELNLIEIFQNAGYKNPPSGAGECAAPKLLQFAFQKKLKPIAMGEFWWGLSPKSDTWKHGQFYPSCKEKCEPILKHMLDGIDDLVFI